MNSEQYEDYLIKLNSVIDYYNGFNILNCADFVNNVLRSYNPYNYVKGVYSLIEKGKIGFKATGGFFDDVL